KLDGFTQEDFRACGRVASMKRGRAGQIVDEVGEAVAKWRSFAAAAQVDEKQVEQIERTHLLHLPHADSTRPGSTSAASA
ncbi:MAG TPA: hypothetical protein VNU19_23615, partial [Candidatus Acidoferrum sp.]|nr:hypothetical protein [Candidatus Acidoferrum sp.]